MPLKSEKQSLFVCFLIVLAAYWPVTSFQFAIKNDFFRSYFPLKQFMGTALKNGIFPLWNPYLNYGFPIFGDMSLAWWNPGTWLVAFFPGYTVWTFTLEQIIYLMLATMGMHKLAGRWTGDMHIRSMAAVAYACCGYFTGQLQHFNWIAAAGTMPLVLLFLLRLMEEGGLRNLAATAFSATWFVTIAHPGLIIGLALFLIFTLASTHTPPERKWSRALSALLLTVLCCGGMMYGYAEVLPYTNRSSNVSASILREGSTTLPSWFSFAMPLSVMKGGWHLNDISLRNCYIGILPLLAVFSAFRRGMPKQARYWAIVGLLFLIISSDLFLPAFRILPPFHYIRLSGELRIFALLAFIIVFSIVMDAFWKHSPERLVSPLKLFRICMILISLAAFFLLPGIPEASWPMPGRVGIRETLSRLDPWFLILTGTVIQLIFSTALINAIRKKSPAFIKGIVFAEFILATSMTLPFTGVGTRSVADLEQTFDRAPRGIPVPANLPEKLVVSNYPDVSLYAGNWALMSRQIAQDGIIEYPLVFGSTTRFMEGKRRREFLEQAPFFLSSGRQAPGCAPEAYQATAMRFMIDTMVPDTLILKQNMFNGWQMTRNGSHVPILETAEGFMGIPLDKGNNQLNILYRHSAVRTLLIVQFILMGILLVMYASGGRITNA